MTPRLFAVALLGLTLAASATEPSAVLTDFGGTAASAPTPQRSTRATGPSTLNASGQTAKKKGVDWLVANQHRDGGWSSGNHGTSGADAPSDVATTAFAVLALHRDGSGARDALTQGITFVVKAVETAPAGPKLNTPEGTQIQTKLGPTVDTHLAALMLGELVRTLDGELQSRARRALETCVRKIEAAQNADGSFDGQAWAPVLSTALAAQGLTQAAEVGLSVDQGVLSRSDAYQTSAQAKAADGAGVELYSVASTLRGATATAGRSGPSSAPAPMRDQARKAAMDAQNEVAANPDGLIAGFGSVGGEEMLSYMMISDSLAAKGGSEWRSWEDKIATFLAKAQSNDGSWVGHHCITSQAFATAGGVITLAAGRNATSG